MAEIIPYEPDMFNNSGGKRALYIIAYIIIQATFAATKVAFFIIKIDNKYYVQKTTTQQNFK